MDDDNQISSNSNEIENETKLNTEQNTENVTSTEDKDVIDVIGNGQLIKKVFMINQHI